MPRSPRQVFAEAARALRRGDWIKAAEQCDFGSLAAFKREQLQRFEPRDERSFTAEDYIRTEPEMPRPVAEYLVARQGKRPSVRQQVRQEFPGIADGAALSAASPLQVFAAWLHGRSVRRQVEELIKQGQISAEHIPAAIAEAAREYDFHIIGTLKDGERTAYVVFREGGSEQGSTSDEVPASLTVEDIPAVENALEPMITACRRQADGSWRLIASHAFLGRAASGWFAFAGTSDTDDPSSEA